MSELHLDQQIAHDALPEVCHGIIRASAGSGKTYQLTGRYLRQLAFGAPPQSILATTFTRKAAGEILARVLGRLAEAIVNAEARVDLARSMKLVRPEQLTEQHCRQMLRRLTQSLHRLAISTIDSFFNRIASSFRFELDLPLDPQIVDAGHPLARQLRLQAIEAMLADDDLHVLLDLLRRLHHDSAGRSVTQAIDSIVVDLYEVYREAPERELWSRIAVPKGLLDEGELAQISEQLRAMEHALPRTAKGDANKSWANAWNKSITAIAARDWKALLKTGIVSKIVAGEDTFGRKEITSDWRAVFDPLAKHARATMIAQLQAQAQATFDLLERFDHHYTRLRTEQRVILFSDLTYKLARYLPSLGDEVLAEVYYRLDGQVSHLLLDEFQDTSLEQWRVLDPFAAEVLPYADGSKSFFCVGDTKQAIYGWRGGCVELFDKIETAVQHFAGDHAKENLSQSYRSSQVVLDAVNEVFSSIADCSILTDDHEAALAWEQRYERHAAAKDLAGYVQLITSPAAADGDGDGSDNFSDNGDTNANDNDGDIAAPASVHEDFAARQVKAIYEKSPGSEVGVLVSTNSAVHRMIYELRKLGLPVSGEGGNPLTDVPAVAAVLSAMTMADHPGHSAAAFHVANSPMGAVVGLKGTSPGDVEQAALRIRRALLDRGYAGVIAEWVRRLAPSCDHRSLTRLTQLVEVAQRFEPMVSLRPAQFVAFVEATPVQEPTPAPIRVMTIHASKGLEFDAVVLPELDRRLTDRWSVLLQRDEPTGPITGVYRHTNKDIRALLPILEEIYHTQKAAQRREDLCKLYVAMTRAKKALYMIVKPVELTKGGDVKSPGLSFATILRQQLGQVEESFDGGQVLYEAGDANWAADRPSPNAGNASQQASPLGQITLAASRERARRGWLAVSPSSLESQGKLRGRDLLDLSSHNARQRGTLMHAWFEAITSMDQPDGVPDDAQLVQIAREYTPTANSAWVTEQMQAFRAMLQKQAIRDVLTCDRDAQLWQEKRFAVVDGPRLMQGAFDRVVIKRDGRQATRATLIDFKTDRVADADAMDLAVQRYRPQMQAYRRALSKMLGLSMDAIEARLVFVSVGEVVNVV